VKKEVSSTFPLPCFALLSIQTVVPSLTNNIMDLLHVQNVESKYDKKMQASKNLRTSVVLAHSFILPIASTFSIDGLRLYDPHMCPTTKTSFTPNIDLTPDKVK